MKRLLLAGAALISGGALAFAASGDSVSSDTFELRVIAETQNTITLGWDPQPGYGYLFSLDGELVSRTNDPARAEVKFRKGTSYEVAAIAKGRTGTYPPAPPSTTTGTTTTEPPPPSTTTTTTTEPPPTTTTEPPPTTTAPEPSSGTLDVYRYTIYPGPYITPYAGGEKHAWYWLVFKQPTVETYFPTSTNQADMANIRWEPGAFYAGRETWVVTSFRFLKGSPGRFLNFHQHVGADGTLCNTRTPPSSCGISPLALDWFRGVPGQAGANGTVVSLGPLEDSFTWPTTYTVLPDTEMATLTGQWVDIVMRIRWGRHDETVKGAVTIWINGVKRFDRDPAPSTFWKNERMTLLWQGGYWYQGVTEETVFEATPYRVGRTLDEALAQRPVLAGPGWGSRGQDGRNANAVKVGTRPVSEIQLP